MQFSSADRSHRRWRSRNKHAVQSHLSIDRPRSEVSRVIENAAGPKTLDEPSVVAYCPAFPPARNWSSFCCTAGVGRMRSAASS